MDAQEAFKQARIEEKLQEIAELDPEFLKLMEMYIDNRYVYYGILCIIFHASKYTCCCYSSGQISLFWAICGSVLDPLSLSHHAPEC